MHEENIKHASFKVQLVHIGLGISGLFTPAKHSISPVDMSKSSWAFYNLYIGFQFKAFIILIKIGDTECIVSLKPSCSLAL
jgi:hypothetical protein